MTSATGPSIDIRLLGDVEVWVDGRTVDVGHTRQRSVLVALLADADQAVSVDQLLFRVWGDRLPQRARGVLHTYLSRLRHALAGDIRIVRQHCGYRIAIDRMAIDMHRFADLASRARAAADGDVALDLFGQALALWRGTPFSTMDTSWSDATREVLNAQRLAVLLDHNDVALARGRHATVLDILSSHADDHALDERLTGQLMMALYRSGRQAEALDLYQRTRRRLVEQLGADPSPPLRQLHQRILTSDPALVVAVSPVPRQLPAAPGRFSGRERELSELDSAIAVGAGAAASVVISAIGGIGGIGKTWLAVRWAQANVDRFPDGQLYVNLSGFDPGTEPLAPATAVRGFLDALGVAPQAVPADLTAQVDLYHSMLAGRRMLILLDNARDTTQVVPLLPNTPTCAVLVTSRNQLAGLVTAHGMHPIAMDVLDESESRRVLAGHLGAHRLAAEPVAVDELVRACGGLPLALAIVAARAALRPTVSLSELADELRHGSTCLDGLDAGELSANLRAVFEASYRALPAAAARVFRLLGLVAGPDIGLAAAANLCAETVSQLRTLLRQLTAASLLAEHRPGRYRMHDLIRLYAAELATSTEHEDALHRVLDYYLHTAHAGVTRLSPLRDEPPPSPCLATVTPEQPSDVDAAIAWFTAEHGVLLAAVEQAADSGFDAHAWQLAWTLTTFFDRQGHWHDRVATQHTAFQAARRAGDRSAEARSRRGLAVAYIWLGQFDEARAQLGRSLELFAELGDRTGEALTYRSLGRAWARQGRHDEAVVHDTRALELFRAIGHRSGLATALNAVGWQHAHLGHYPQALSYCQQALRMHEAIDDRHAQASTWDSLGYIHHRLGQHQPALRCYEHALRLYRATGDRYQEADTLKRLGDTQHAMGDITKAQLTRHAAAAILTDMGHGGPDGVQDGTKTLAAA